MRSVIPPPRSTTPYQNYMKGVQFDCVDCGHHTQLMGEYYTLVKSVWWEAVDKRPDMHTVMLCIGCLEERLGRRLTPGDFDPTLWVNRRPEEHSLRLKDRLRRAK